MVHHRRRLESGQTSSFLLKNVSLLTQHGQAGVTDISISEGLIRGLSDFQTSDETIVIDGQNGLVIPGLTDHHVHLASFAASLASVNCGPPSVTTESELVEAINQPGTGWLRGIGYHESVLSVLDRAWLDRHGPSRPIKIQHRSGRLWVLNSLGMELINDTTAKLTPHERSRLNSPDGRLYDLDELLGQITLGVEPPIAQASDRLAAFGVTAINDMTPSNDGETWQWFSELQARGDLLQKVRMSGRPGLESQIDTPELMVGETKVHLHDASLPDFGDFVEIIVNSHAQNRGVAVHCVTEVELVFTLSAFRAAGTNGSDRIEHASVVPPQLIEQLVELDLGVVTQPNFVAERGEAYLADIPVKEHPFLYRIKSLLAANVSLAFGTDLPFGNPDPWFAMSAATRRVTDRGNSLGANERISAEEAISRFLGDLNDPFTPGRIEPGAPADLCLLDVPWQALQSDLTSDHVRMTLCDGKIIYSRD
jgi:predicted amidohydrolase YtcJ